MRNDLPEGFVSCQLASSTPPSAAPGLFLSSEGRRHQQQNTAQHSDIPWRAARHGREVQADFDLYP